MCPQWQEHGYCWAVPALQSCSVGSSRTEAGWGSSGSLVGASRMPFSAWGTQITHRDRFDWTLLKSTQGRSNSAKISKCIRGHKLPSKLSTCTQVLLTESLSPMKVFPRVDRCYQHAHPTWFSISEGFFVSLFLWRVLRRQHFGLVIYKKGGGGARERGTGCDKRCYWPISYWGKRANREKKHVKAEVLKINLVLFFTNK